MDHERIQAAQSQDGVEISDCGGWIRYSGDQTPSPEIDAQTDDEIAISVTLANHTSQDKTAVVRFTVADSSGVVETFAGESGYELSVPALSTVDTTEFFVPSDLGMKGELTAFATIVNTFSAPSGETAFDACGSCGP